MVQHSIRTLQRLIDNISLQSFQFAVVVKVLPQGVVPCQRALPACPLQSLHSLLSRSPCLQDRIDMYDVHDATQSYQV